MLTSTLTAGLGKLLPPVLPDGQRRDGFIGSETNPFTPQTAYSPLIDAVHFSLPLWGLYVLLQIRRPDDRRLQCNETLQRWCCMLRHGRLNRCDRIHLLHVPRDDRLLDPSTDS